MSRPTTPLPADLACRPFTVAEARRRGLRRGRTRSAGLTTPTSGVRVHGPCDELADHVAAYALVLPEDVALSHLTAARVHRLPTPTSWPGPDEPVDVRRERSRPRIRRAGCAHHRGLETREVVDVDGLLVTSPIDTWCDLAGQWDGPALLAAADELVRRRTATTTELVTAAASREGRPDVGLLRTVAPWARVGAASPRESHLRWWVMHWGLPEPELNATILDVHGQWLAVGDLVWRRARVVAEYDGDQHRADRRRWLGDRERRAALEDDGWRFVAVTSRTLDLEWHPEALRRRLERFLR